MNRSTFFSAHRIVTALIAVFFVLIVGAAAFFLTRQEPIPPTGVVSPAQVEVSSHRSIDLGAGYTLEMDGMQGKIAAPAAPPRTARQTIDLGAGYSLEMAGSAGKVLAPARVSYQRMDIGAGYVLEMTSTGAGRILVPVAASPVKASPAAYRLDLGSGFSLEMTGAQGKFIAPTYSSPANQPALDLGSGYWLVDGQIVQEGSR